MADVEHRGGVSNGSVSGIAALHVASHHATKRRPKTARAGARRTTSQVAAGTSPSPSLGLLRPPDADSLRFFEKSKDPGFKQRLLAGETGEEEEEEEKRKNRLPSLPRGPLVPPLFTLGNLDIIFFWPCVSGSPVQFLIFQPKMVLESSGLPSLRAVRTWKLEHYSTCPFSGSLFSVCVA